VAIGLSNMAPSVAPTSATLLPTERKTRLAYHFVGIGGCGMSGLAQMLHRRGYRITGSDARASVVTDNLARLGIAVRIGPGSGLLPGGLDAVVASAAVPQDDPDLTLARQQGLRVLKYAQMLGEISTGYETLAVAGTHGKSTTSGWLAYGLHHAGREPNFVVGAEVIQLGAGSGAGRGEHLVVEACEYDRSFLNLQPRAAAILNVEPDHLDYYRDLPEIVDAFGAFAARVDHQGLVVVPAADPNAVQAAACATARTESFSLTGPADWQPGRLSFENGHGCFDVLCRGQSLGRVKLSLPGRHNVANALAVAALARHVGLDDPALCAALESFAGVGRRLMFKAVLRGITLLDDYAHHPTEIQVTLEAVRQKYRPRCLWCVFQPHQHSRTRALLQEFAGSFRHADVVLLSDIYFVRDTEASRREITAAMLAERIAAQGGRASYLGDFARIADLLAAQAQDGDVIITMGAGDVGKLADELVARLGRDR